MLQVKLCCRNIHVCKRDSVVLNKRRHVKRHCRMTRAEMTALMHIQILHNAISLTYAIYTAVLRLTSNCSSYFIVLVSAIERSLPSPKQFETHVPN